MGDRGNIAVLQSNGDQVWLYSHWGGYDLPNRLQQALARRWRWSDESYLTKIIFGHAVAPDSWRQECNYGISCRLQDNEYAILVVDIPGQRVFTMPEDKLDEGKVPAGYKPTKRTKPFSFSSSTVEGGPWTFEEYSTLEKLPWGEREKVEGAA